MFKAILGSLTAIVLAAVVGCAGVSAAVKVCVEDPKYGSICAEYIDGKVVIVAGVVLPVDVEERIKALVLSLVEKN